MWLDEDVAAAIAWQDEQALKCPGCGTPTDESMASDAAYIAEAHTCQSCRSTDLAKKSAHDDGGETAGMFWVSRPAPPL